MRSRKVQVEHENMVAPRSLGSCANANEPNPSAKAAIFDFIAVRLIIDCSMIALLSGVLVEKHPNQAIVDVAGVGYDVTIPISTFSKLPEAGAAVRLRIHTHVREDALALYGFLSADEKALFEKLSSV